MVLVKFIELNTEVVERSLEDGSTVGDLFDMLDKNIDAGQVTICQSSVNEDTRLRDGDRVFFAKKTKGNNEEAFEVKFIKLGGGVFTVAIGNGTTIDSALNLLSTADKAQFVRPDGKPACEYRLKSGSVVEGSHVIVRNPAGPITQIICAQRTKGN